MELIFTGQASPAQIGAFLGLLSAKGETVQEITEISKILHNEMIEVKGLKNALDIVGTGGDGYDTINVSTLSFFLCPRQNSLRRISQICFKAFSHN